MVGATQVGANWTQPAHYFGGGFDFLSVWKIELARGLRDAFGGHRNHTVYRFATTICHAVIRCLCRGGGGLDAPVTDSNATAIWVASGLALFTIVFGTRNLDVNERHYGVVMAIAVEAVVKLCALLAVGIFVVWGVSGGVSETLQRIDASAIGMAEIHGGRWAALTFLSGAAFLCLPRMFQVLVVENEDESHLQTASWAFPVYVMLISLFVIPIAVVRPANSA